MDTLMRLKNVPLFASLAPDNLARVALLATRCYYPKGSRLCRQDEFGETLYVIDSGEAIQHQTDLRGVERPVGYLRAGDFVGDDALLLGDAYSSCVQATTDVEALCIRKQDFDRLLEEYPEIRQQLTVRRLIMERFRAPTFPWQDEDEPSLLLRRRHWFVLTRTLATPLLILLLLTIATWLLRWLNIIMSLPLTLLLVGALPAIMVLWYLMDWRNDFYLVTTKRILHREKIIFLYEAWDEAPLAKIQNINIAHDFWGKMLGFGTMHIETASARGTIVLNYLPDPEGMQEIIFRQASYLKWRLKQEEREEIRQELLQQAEKPETEEGSPLFPLPPQEQPRKRSGLLGRLLPSRPLLRLRYEQANEITWRKHWVFLIKRIYLALPAALITTTLVTISLYRWPTQHGFSLLLASLVLWIAAIFWLWWEVEDWRNDIYIVTDRLIIDIEKKPLFFAEDRKQATLDMIQNVSLHIPGPLATILNYGDVLIQTAGPGGALNFNGVSHPAEVQREIFRRMEAYNEAQRHQEMEQRKAELSTWFQVYREMEQRRESPSASRRDESVEPSGHRPNSA